jgi:hypothetical protein
MEALGLSFPPSIGESLAEAGAVSQVLETQSSKPIADVFLRSAVSSRFYAAAAVAGSAYTGALIGSLLVGVKKGLFDNIPNNQTIEPFTNIPFDRLQELGLPSRFPIRHESIPVFDRWYLPPPQTHGRYRQWSAAEKAVSEATRHKKAMVVLA